MIKIKRTAIILYTLFIYSHVAYSQVVLNEIMPANISGIHDEFYVDKQVCPVEDCNWWFEMMGEPTCDGDYPDWIELYNTADSAVDLNGFAVSDDPEEPFKWVFPSVTVEANQKLIVFATGNDIKNPVSGNYMHTNFKIDNDGETITLSNNLGLVIDQFVMGAVPPDFSYGRAGDGDSAWVIFQQPSPDKQNEGVVFRGFTESITSSVDAGFYSAPINVSLSSKTGSVEIKYTTDGSTPDTNSTTYSTPINLSATTVLKARCYNADTIKSEVMCATYFMHDNFTMPVVSLSTDPDNFWSEETGIYVHGNYPVDHSRVANYWQDWERPVNIEFFETNGSREFSVNAGVKIMGWGSRANARKSLAFFFRDRYGESKLNYPILENQPFDTYKSFVLRSGGGDWQSTLIRDVYASDLVGDKDLDYQKFRPVIVYINGEYWGIHNIREKLNTDYLDSHYDLDKDKIDIISRYWRSPVPIVVQGNNEDYNELENYVKKNDMNTIEAYNYAESVMDLNNMLDYICAEIYYANYDWPAHNTKYWKSRTPASHWRWLMYDMDHSMNSHDHNPYTHNTLAKSTTSSGKTAASTLLIRKLMQNDEFRDAFVNRIGDLMNTRFLYDTTSARLQEIKDLYAAEMQEHIDRWGSFGSTLNSVNEWNNNISVIDRFFEHRSVYVKNHFKDYFNLSTWKDFTLDVSGKGKIKINSIIPGNYPWTGQYVPEVPVSITALPEPGYKFSGWEGVTSEENSARISILISDSDNVKANFIATSEEPTIVINEVNYNSSEEVAADDWIELYNPYSTAIDISGWKFSDSDDLHEFIFPPNTIIGADDYLVVCQDSSDFEKAHPTVNNYMGTFNFGLSSDTETLRLYNEQNILIDSFTYTTTSPWPEQANGFGPTLSLIESSSENSQAENWGYSVGYGSPGAENQINRLHSISDISEEFLIQKGNDILLNQNYPNPFISVTYIPFYLYHSDRITLSIIDIRGKVIDEIYSGFKSAGNHLIEYHPNNLSHGLYYYKIETSTTVMTKPMVKF